MGIIELILISLGLAMDAFAIAVCKGLSMAKMKIKNAIVVGLWFGTFQGVMPILGYLLGNTFENFINSIDNLIAFILLIFIGTNMVGESFKKEEPNIDDNISFKGMLILAIATSIDALTIGITFAFFDVNIIIAALMIGTITFLISMLGVIIGNKFGNKYEKKAQIIGGVILIALALKNLIEHFGIF